MKKKLFRTLIWVDLGLTALCLVAAALSAFYNRSLPTHSQFTEKLSTLEKAHLAEVVHLRQSLGSEVWPGWGELDIPLIVYNEEYAFLVGYADPPDGWYRMPQKTLRGGAWEVVPDDTFDGQLYYRQRLPNPEITPENFTVLVGERWTATMLTREYAEIRFYAEMRDQMPPVLQAVFPYPLLWGLIMGETENYLGGLEHESFHAFQGTITVARLAEAEYANSFESDYPWDDADHEEAWISEMDLLVGAVNADSQADAVDLARQFLAQRAQRRASAGLSAELVDYERQREWLEGLAKYAELALTLAAQDPGYTPLPALDADPNFKHYTTRRQFWNGQVSEATRTAGRSGETRFYYSGMVQAALLDRLAPGWKSEAFAPGVMLEDLLETAVR